MRLARWIGIPLAVLLVLLLAADRIGVRLAQDAAASSLESSQHLPSRPDVQISGFPFLTQLAAGNYDKITITATDVPVGEQSRLLTIGRLQVVLHGLSVSRDFHTFRADTASATGLVPLDELARTLGVRLRYAGNGRVRATRTVSVGGVPITATVTARPLLRHGALSFTDPVIENAGVLGRTVSASLGQLFAVAIPLQNIPFGVRVRALAVGADGVTFRLAGRNLTYVR